MTHRARGGTLSFAFVFVRFGTHRPGYERNRRGLLVVVPPSVSRARGTTRSSDGSRLLLGPRGSVVPSVLFLRQSPPPSGGGVRSFREDCPRLYLQSPSPTGEGSSFRETSRSRSRYKGKRFIHDPPPFLCFVWPGSGSAKSTLYCVKRFFPPILVE